MKKFTNLAYLTFALLIAFTACDNPASNDEEEHAHLDPAGIQLVHDGQVIITYQNNTVTENTHMHLHAGEEYDFEVHFLAEDGDELHGEDIDSDYSLRTNVENENVLAIHQDANSGRWSFHIDAIAEGESRVQFLLWHGSHSDFETPAVTSAEAIEFHVEAGDGHNDEHNH